MPDSCIRDDDACLRNDEVTVKILIWSVFALLALLWTGTAWAGAALTDWVVGLLGSDAGMQLGTAIGSWPIPAWLTYWVDVAAIHAVLDGVAWTMESLQQTWPWIGAALGWLVPLIWAGWGIGLVVLLALAVIAHLLVGRIGRRPPAVAAA